ncbi:MAG: DUF2092 domain-containing protein [Pseudomonadota bacterium]
MSVNALPALAWALALICASSMNAPWAAAQDQSTEQAQEAPAAESDEAAEPEEPDAEAIVLDSVEFLAGLPAFGFNWFVSYDVVDDGREKLTFTRSGSNLIVRGEGFSASSEEGFKLRDYYYDGETFTVSAPEEDFYASRKFDQGFEALVVALRERTDTVLPLWTIMAEDLPDRMVTGADLAAYVGLTRIGGVVAHHIAFAGYQEDWQIWIADDPDAPVPIYIVGTESDEKGWPQYRAWLSDWDLAPETTPEQFVFTPDENDLPAALPDLAARPTTAEPASEEAQQ